MAPRNTGRDDDDRHRSDRPGEWTWTVDLLGVFTACTSSGDILGYDPAELVGRNIASIMDPQELTRASAMVQATGIPDSGLSQLVAPARHRDGTTRWGETTVQTLTDPDGAVIGYQGRSRLISRRPHWWSPRSRPDPGSKQCSPTDC